MDKETDFLGGVAKMALGIFFGALLCWMAVHYYAQYVFRQVGVVTEQAAAELIASGDRVKAAAERRLQEQAAARQRADQERAALQAAQWRQQRQLQESERRKEAAWRAFYQPSAQCLKEASVECGNAHIRARRDFEHRYSAGEIF